MKSIIAKSQDQNKSKLHFFFFFQLMLELKDEIESIATLCSAHQGV